mmetsp:Transcript_43385/g.82768  ORF Transcript_43385/g.82768 Transcript_43385/m.82768 type:complete len:357 (+) Transcript_43385:1450-2520(+)
MILRSPRKFVGHRYSVQVKSTLVLVMVSQCQSHIDEHETYVLALQNKTILFLGDSVTRYQYISLVMFLRHKKWPGNHVTYLGEPNPIYEKYWQLPEHESGEDLWRSYYEGTNRLLGGREICDCFRRRVKQHTKLSQDDQNNLKTILAMPATSAEKPKNTVWALATENRLYYHDDHDIKVGFFQVLGNVAQPRGHMYFDKVLRKPTCRPGSCGTSYLFHHTLHTFLAEIHSIIQPTQVILNYGIWRSTYSAEEKQLQAIVAQTFQNISFIWKDSTPQKKGFDDLSAKEWDMYLRIFNPYGWLHFNTSDMFATLFGNPDDRFLDPMHFVGEIYMEMNRAFFRQFWSQNESTIHMPHVT